MGEVFGKKTEMMQQKRSFWNKEPTDVSFVVSSLNLLASKVQLFVAQISMTIFSNPYAEVQMSMTIFSNPYAEVQMSMTIFSNPYAEVDLGNERSTLASKCRANVQRRWRGYQWALMSQMESLENQAGCEGHQGQFAVFGEFFGQIIGWHRHLWDPPGLGYLRSSLAE